MDKGQRPAEGRSKPGEIQAFVLADDGVFPNNHELPLIVYRGIFDSLGHEAASRAQELLAQNGWTGSWVNGIYGYHHYHSTAHEVLVVTAGKAKVQFGGEQGVTASVSAGDAVVIPAGVAHKSLGAANDFTVVGAYPEGQRPDVCYGRKGERPGTDRSIAALSLPGADPLTGSSGPLAQLWHLQGWRTGLDRKSS